MPSLRSSSLWRGISAAIKDLRSACAAIPHRTPLSPPPAGAQKVTNLTERALIIFSEIDLTPTATAAPDVASLLGALPGTCKASVGSGMFPLLPPQK